MIHREYCEGEREPTETVIHREYCEGEREPTETVIHREYCEGERDGFYRNICSKGSFTMTK